MRGIYIIETDPDTDKVTGHTIHYKNGRPVTLKFTRCSLDKVTANAARLIHNPTIYRLNRPTSDKE